MINIFFDNKWNLSFFKNLVISNIKNINFVDISDFDTDCIEQNEYYIGYSHNISDKIIEFKKTLEEKKIDHNKIVGNIYCHNLTNNKYLARKLIPSLNTIYYYPVYSDMKNLPNEINKKMIFKPIEGGGSNGIFVFDNNITNNPYYDNKSNLIGIVEEYINPKFRKFALDGFVYNYEIYHYCISENVYHKSNPEKFDYCLTPVMNLSKSIVKLMWEKYDLILNFLINNGLNNQFCDIEVFLIDEKEIKIEIMEINCRTFTNQLPIFTKLFSDNSMFEISCKLIKNENPNISKNFYDKIIENKDGNVGISKFYYDLNIEDDVIKNENLCYYKIDNFCSHIYSVAETLEICLKNSKIFYEELKSNCI